jgi:hypothetical protein
MDIRQIQEFRLFDRRDPNQLFIVRFHRIDWGAFQNCFRMEKKTQSGELIDAKPATEEFAKMVLDQALLCLPKEDIEIVKLSTGTQFNYPTPHV